MASRHEEVIIFKSWYLMIATWVLCIFGLDGKPGSCLTLFDYFLRQYAFFCTFRKTAVKIARHLGVLSTLPVDQVWTHRKDGPWGMDFYLSLCEYSTL